jgi:hypothetical protein
VRGADPLIRAGPPGPALPQIDTSGEADEGVGCGPGGPPHEARWPLPSGDFQSHWIPPALEPVVVKLPLIPALLRQLRAIGFFQAIDFIVETLRIDEAFGIVRIARLVLVMHLELAGM